MLCVCLTGDQSYRVVDAPHATPSMARRVSGPRPKVWGWPGPKTKDSATICSFSAHLARRTSGGREGGPQNSSAVLASRERSTACELLGATPQRRKREKPPGQRAHPACLGPERKFQEQSGFKASCSASGPASCGRAAARRPSWAEEGDGREKRGAWRERGRTTGPEVRRGGREVGGGGSAMGHAASRGACKGFSRHLRHPLPQATTIGASRRRGGAVNPAAPQSHE